MKTFFERLWARESPRRSVPRPTAIRPQREALETRLTPSAAAIQTAVLKTDGELDLYNTQTGVFQLLSPGGATRMTGCCGWFLAGGMVWLLRARRGQDANGRPNGPRVPAQVDDEVPVAGGGGGDDVK